MILLSNTKGLSITVRVFKRALPRGEVLLSDNGDYEKNDGENGDGRSIAKVFDVSETSKWCDDKSNEKSNEGLLIQVPSLNRK